MIKRKRQQLIQLSGEGGFTIIESLVALLVVAILLTAIAPVIVLSTAVRVQSKRVERAMQASKTFIDSVKTDTSSDGITSKIKIIEVALPNKDRKIEDNLIDTTKMPAPTKSDDLFCYQNDGTIQNPTCTKDSNTLFYIQAAQIKAKDSQISDGSRLGIRIYRSDVDFAKKPTASEDNKKVTQRTVTPGVGDRQAPLLEMTTEIGSRDTSYNALCQRLAVEKSECN